MVFFLSVQIILLEVIKMDNSNTKSDQVKLTEHLSALLDDEAGSFEQRRVLDELRKDDSLSQKLSSYALIGETMRSDHSQTQVAGASFLAGIHEKIEAEPEYHSIQLEEPKKANSSAWLRPVGGFALAASVAAIAVLGFQNYKLGQGLPSVEQTAFITAQTQPSPSKEQLSESAMKSATIVSAATLVAANDSKVNETNYQQADASMRSYLKRFVDSHMQYASTTAFVPSVRVIAYADY